MSTTQMSNMINPEVMGDMIDAKITALAKLTPYAKVDTTLQGVPGDTKTVPSWNYIGDAEDVAEGAEVGLTTMTASTTTFTIKKAMKSVGITQEAINSGLGNPVGQAETQLAKSIVGKVDNDVLTSALTASNIYDGTAAIIGYSPIVNAVGKFEDEEDNIEKVMFINPVQETTLLQDSNFISADKFEAGVAVNGSIGKIAGCWIKKSKKVVKVDAVDAVSAVQGTYTITFATNAAANDSFTINACGETFNYTVAAASDTPTTTATAVQAILNSASAVTDVFTITRTAGVITLTQKTGGVGASPTAVAKTENTQTVTAAAGTTGVKAVTAKAAHYKCPIIKLEPDSAETEYTEDELPALTIFLKKDTQTDAEFIIRKQTHEITTAKYYGVALTNAAKVVIAEFKA